MPESFDEEGGIEEEDEVDDACEVQAVLNGDDDQVDLDAREDEVVPIEEGAIST